MVISKKTNKKNIGFTLIELLVVIVIVGLLASITLVAVKNAVDKAKVVAGLQFSANLKNAKGAYIFGEWEFEKEGEGNCSGTEPYNDICDSSGNGNHGDNHGVSWESNPPQKISVLKTAGFFEGTDCVEFPPIKNIKTISVEGWVHRTSDNFGYLWTRYDGSISAGGIAFEKSNFPNWGIRVYIGVCLGHFGTSNVSLNTWNHVVMTYDDNRIRAYLNGKEINADSGETISDCGAIPESTRNIIGRLSPSFPSGVTQFVGYMDEVRIYSEALSSAQIQKLYVGGAMERGLVVKE